MIAARRQIQANIINEIHRHLDAHDFDGNENVFSL
jgi:hypothetical protein